MNEVMIDGANINCTRKKLYSLQALLDIKQRIATLTDRCALDAEEATANKEAETFRVRNLGKRVDYLKSIGAIS